MRICTDCHCCGIVLVRMQLGGLPRAAIASFHAIRVRVCFRMFSRAALISATRAVSRAPLVDQADLDLAVSGGVVHFPPLTKAPKVPECPSRICQFPIFRFPRPYIGRRLVLPRLNRNGFARRCAVLLSPSSCRVEPLVPSGPMRPTYAPAYRKSRRS